jgi:hypothetical protein
MKREATEDRVVVGSKGLEQSLIGQSNEAAAIEEGEERGVVDE